MSTGYTMTSHFKASENGEPIRSIVRTGKSRTQVRSTMRRVLRGAGVSINDATSIKDNGQKAVKEVIGREAVEAQAAQAAVFDGETMVSPAKPAVRAKSAIQAVEGREAVEATWEVVVFVMDEADIEALKLPLTAEEKAAKREAKAAALAAAKAEAKAAKEAARLAAQQEAADEAAAFAMGEDEAEEVETENPDEEEFFVDESNGDDEWGD